jgi:hypothetical protein
MSRAINVCYSTMSDRSTEQRQPWPRRIAIALTVVGVVVVVTATLAAFHTRGAPTSLSDWGAWLAGVFAPLAFLWLVVGYHQQGEELRQNTAALKLQEEALRLQVGELRQSVDEQRAMSAAAKRQAASAEFALLLQYQPDIVCTHAGHAEVYNYQPSDTGEVRLEFFNAGKNADHAFARGLGRPPILDVKTAFPHRWTPADRIAITVTYQGNPPLEFGLEFWYVDQLGQWQHTDYWIELRTTVDGRATRIVTKLPLELRSPGEQHKPPPHDD